MKTSREILFDLYRRLYEQRAILPDAPAMTVQPVSADTLDYAKTRGETKQVISYLLGVPDIEAYSFDEGIQLIDAYQDQPFWRELVVAWFDLIVTEESEGIEVEKERLKEEMGDWIDFLDARDELKKAYIRAMAGAIRAGGFHVDGEKLARNYFKMFLTDEETAVKTLETNPAFFAPIQVTDGNGNIVLSPKAAADENKRLGKYLAHLKIDIKSQFN